MFQCTYCGWTQAETDRFCPACNTLNLPEAERCLQCGEALSITERIFDQRTPADAPVWLTRTSSLAGGLQESERQASKKRMQRFEEIENLRQTQLSQARSKKARDDQLLITLGFVLAFIILAVIVLVLIF
jgi:hypothetical protein